MEINKFTGKPIYTNEEKQRFEKKPGKKPYNKEKKERQPKPAPVYDEFQKEITADLMRQVEAFYETHGAAMPDAEAKKMSEKNLFSIYPAWPFVIGEEGNETGEMWQLDRSVRMDRETGELHRASCSLVVLDWKERIPMYFIQANMNKNGGMITVTPMGDKAPNYHNALRTKIPSITDFLKPVPASNFEDTPVAETETTAE